MSGLRLAGPLRAAACSGAGAGLTRTDEARRGRGVGVVGVHLLAASTASSRLRRRKPLPPSPAARPIGASQGINGCLQLQSSPTTRAERSTVPDVAAHPLAPQRAPSPMACERRCPPTGLGEPAKAARPPSSHLADLADLSMGSMIAIWRLVRSPASAPFDRPRPCRTPNSDERSGDAVPNVRRAGTCLELLPLPLLRLGHLKPVARTDDCLRFQEVAAIWLRNLCTQ
ncbi:hypothetical protein P171DRAFT_439630 [Karstenula rhodostoma CBS 690.94]|uniref:Uncharacterized protein n=1 Tax=Karstenula rhodostoma CBS 690.94 TaxID=1392251 RepID=A0A9P4PXH3_9PLEO|nr:hypothetical protein P171DRAFT_439630 [Karstenula rhodostoma CBS 690.94]